jgi:hypothetical protein
VAQPPEQAVPVRLGGKEQVLQVLQLHLIGGLRERRQRLLYAQVVDLAGIYRQDRVRAEPVEAKPPALGAGDGLELAPDPVAPRVVHAKHRCVRRKAKPGARPCLLDHLALELELVRVRGVLELASTTFAEVRAWRRHAMR